MKKSRSHNKTMTEVRLALVCVLLLAAASAALGSRADLLRPVCPCFVGPAVAMNPAGTKMRTESAPAASQGVQPASHQNQQRRRRPAGGGGGGSDSSSSTASSGTSALAKRMLLRRALARPKPRTGGGAAAADPSPKVAADVDNLFRLEVAQRMKEMKLMTQPGVGPLSPVAVGAAPAGGVAVADSSSSLSPLLPSNKKLELESATALEQQIALLSSRITSIADHLQTTPADAVSRKGLVVLVKRRRRLLETLRHRDQDRWLATTETLGLRQRRPDISSAGGAGEPQDALAARRRRRRDRGRRRRRDDN